MKVSVIVPAFNEEKLLVDTLRSIRSAAEVFARTGWAWELIVCDNNSTDRTTEIAESEGARVVFEAKNQISRARNAGAAAATGDWLLFIDADSTPSWKHFENVRNCIRSGRHLAGGCHVQMEPMPPWAKAVQHVWNWVSRTFRLAAGSFLFAERRAFEEAGGFSEEVYATEELILSAALNTVAKRRGLQALHIMPSPALLTSGRKMDLYTAEEHFRFILRGIFNKTKTLGDADACHLWYDGRR
tara:strand:- start:2103 stop:2831 length:729 start_codon:yes stop_codon:yes gene_type:complete